jgi:hypothetical protein
MEEFEKRRALYLAARPFARDEVFSQPCPVPKSPGVYGWWFRTTPGAIDVSHCAQRNGLTLLYTGISPKRPPSNGKPPSSQNLRKRIINHYGGSAEGSTLRKTLGVLLSDELGIELRRVGSGRRRTFGRHGEALLTDWMADNALVSWVVLHEPWLFEKDLIDTLDLPLNLSGNKHNAFHTDLTGRRAEAEKKAGDLPVLNER